MLIRTVVFDFDFTLADSSAAVVECANHALGLMGLGSCEPERVCRTIGLSLSETFRRLTHGDDPRLAAEFSRHFLERADEVMALRAAIFPGVPATLSALRRSGMRLAIVSTKRRRTIEAILECAALTGAVDVIVGGEDVQQHKPHPEGLLAALAQLETDVSQALYVGDHPVDAQAAARAGMAFVAVRTGYSPPETWNAYAPLAIVDGVSGVLDLVNRPAPARAE